MTAQAVLPPLTPIFLIDKSPEIHYFLIDVLEIFLSFFTHLSACTGGL